MIVDSTEQRKKKCSPVGNPKGEKSCGIREKETPTKEERRHPLEHKYLIVLKFCKYEEYIKIMESNNRFVKIHIK